MGLNLTQNMTWQTKVSIEQAIIHDLTWLANMVIKLGQDLRQPDMIMAQPNYLYRFTSTTSLCISDMIMYTYVHTYTEMHITHM